MSSFLSAHLQCAVNKVCVTCNVSASCRKYSQTWLQPHSLCNIPSTAQGIRWYQLIPHWKPYQFILLCYNNCNECKMWTMYVLEFHVKFSNFDIVCSEFPFEIVCWKNYSSIHFLAAKHGIAHNRYSALICRFLIPSQHLTPTVTWSNCLNWNLCLCVTFL
jgi:hypothetical protein